MNENDGTITSSPLPISCARRAACSADVPEFTATQCFVPTNSCKLFSNSSISCPIAHVCPLLMTLFTIFSSSSSV